MSQWQLLLDRAITGLSRLRAKRQPVPDWVLGGGTALMIHVGHRLSKDIDAFIDDPPCCRPDWGGEDVWTCEAFEEASNYLKLIYVEGEIDFIVAPSITGLPTERKAIDSGDGASAPHVLNVEHPVEIAIKKLNYRGSLLRVRDIFDIAVIDSLFPVLLSDNLNHLTHLKPAIVERLSGISDEFCRRELEELSICAEWQSMAGTCLKRVREIAICIPEKQR